MSLHDIDGRAGEQCARPAGMRVPTAFGHDCLTGHAAVLERLR